MQTTARVTLADYDRLPEGAPFELIGGVLYHRVTDEAFESYEDALAYLEANGMSPAPTFFHQQIVQNLNLLLAPHVRRHQLGQVVTAPVDVVLAGEDDVPVTVQPDLLFLSQERLGLVQHGRIVGAPDLVAEVLSPSTAYRDLRAKRDLYDAAGVREYWIVDPIKQRVEVYTRTAGGALALTHQSEAEATSGVLGVTVIVPDLFA